MDGVQVQPGFVVAESDLSERFSHSSGPGGQGVNTSSSRVELSLDLRRARSVPEGLRARVLARLEQRVVDGVLTVACSQFRDQLANRRQARLRMAAILRAVAAPPAARRRPTRPSRRSQERRLDAKKRRGAVKEGRRAPREW